MQVTNDLGGMRKLLDRLNRYQLQRTVVEKIERFECEVVSAAFEKVLPIIAVIYVYVRCYLDAIGMLAKTDKLSEKLIAQYAAMIFSKLNPPS